jgi:2,5-diamino-6-(ribosylamino)-4(3H)-pyrimidinone 5'-phosphate reductase
LKWANRHFTGASRSRIFLASVVVESRGRWVMDLPFVVGHVAVSLDGATTGFDVDVGRYYSLIQTWDEDVTLAGADTILAQEAVLDEAPMPGPKEGAPILAAVDSRRRVTSWDKLRRCGYWSDVVALRIDTHQEGEVAEIVTAGPPVDLRLALHRLADERGAKVVRVDSGGALLGALLSEGLVDELSLLVHPLLTGRPQAQRWFGTGEDRIRGLDLLGAERSESGLLWLRYAISSNARSASSAPDG